MLRHGPGLPAAEASLAAAPVQPGTSMSDCTLAYRAPTRLAARTRYLMATGRRQRGTRRLLAPNKLPLASRQGRPLAPANATSSWRRHTCVCGAFATKTRFTTGDSVAVRFSISSPKEVESVMLFATVDGLEDGCPLDRANTYSGSDKWEGTFSLPRNVQIDYTFEFQLRGERLAIPARRIMLSGQQTALDTTWMSPELAEVEAFLNAESDNSEGAVSVSEFVSNFTGETAAEIEEEAKAQDVPAPSRPDYPVLFNGISGAVTSQVLLLKTRIAGVRLRSQIAMLEDAMRAISEDEKRLAAAVDRWLEDSERALQGNWRQEVREGTFELPPLSNVVNAKKSIKQRMKKISSISVSIAGSVDALETAEAEANENIAAFLESSAEKGVPDSELLATEKELSDTMCTLARFPIREARQALVVASEAKERATNTSQEGIKRVTRLQERVERQSNAVGFVGAPGSFLALALSAFVILGGAFQSRDLLGTLQSSPYADDSNMDSNPALVTSIDSATEPGAPASEAPSASPAATSDSSSSEGLSLETEELITSVPSDAQPIAPQSPPAAVEADMDEDVSTSPLSTTSPSPVADAETQGKGLPATAAVVSVAGGLVLLAAQSMNRKGATVDEGSMIEQVEKSSAATSTSTLQKQSEVDAVPQSGTTVVTAVSFNDAEVAEDGTAEALVSYENVVTSAPLPDLGEEAKTISDEVSSPAMPIEYSQEEPSSQASLPAEVPGPASAVDKTPFEVPVASSNQQPQGNAPPGNTNTWRLLGAAFSLMLAAVAGMVYEGLISVTWKVLTSAVLLCIGTIVALVKVALGGGGRTDSSEGSSPASSGEPHSNRNGGGVPMPQPAT
mmetsp:Transcript_8498/g.31404  ORF Transcript_8498/g.31404 Transcript_8498/m.31404 type:complete len:849 (-) Transcript_8498:79-2625(-)